MKETQLLLTTLSCEVNRKIKNEKEFTTFLWKHIKSMWWFFYKIPDVDRWYKPFDAIVSMNWWQFALELKITKNQTCRIHPYLRPNQHASLDAREKNWWLSIVWVMSIPLQKYKFIVYNEIDLSTKITFDA